MNYGYTVSSLISFLINHSPVLSRPHLLIGAPDLRSERAAGQHRGYDIPPLSTSSLLSSILNYGITPSKQSP